MDLAKKINKYLLVLALLLPAAAGFGQNNVLKINPLSLATLTGNLKYERFLTKTFSLEATVFANLPVIPFYGDQHPFLPKTTYRIGWQGVRLDAKFFRFSMKNSGDNSLLYLGPNLNLTRFQIIDRWDGTEMLWEDRTTISFTGGLVMGWQKPITPHLTFDFFGGIAAGYGETMTTKVTFPNPTTELTRKGFVFDLPRLGCSLGYRF